MGAAWASCAALCWALYIVFGRRVGAATEGGVGTALGMVVATVVVVPFGVAEAGARLLEPAILPAGFAVAMRAPTVPRAGIRVSDLSDDALREYLRALGGTPPEVLAHDLLMELLLPVLRADLMVVDDYVCRGLPVTCPVTALGGRDDAQVSPAALSAWGHCTHGPFRVRMFPGGHFFPRTEREALLSLLAGELAAVADRRPDPAQEPGMSLRSQA